MNAPFKSPVATRDPFSAFLSDPDSEDMARAVATSFGWPADRVHNGGITYASQTLAVTASPSVLLVDISESEDPFADIDGLAEVVEPGTLVLACGTINDVQLYRQLIASGIQDYLLKPFTDAQLREAVMSAQINDTEQRERERIAANVVEHLGVAVIGVRGGSGASSIALSAAWALAEKRNASTALLDLDVHFGSAALALDLDPGRGLTDAIENPNRIDGLFIERALVRVNDRLGVLSAEAPIHQPITADSTAFLLLQDELRTAFSCAVLDLPRHMLIEHPSLIENVGVAVVVTELTLAATRDTIRLLAWLKSKAPRTRIVLVANKVPAAGGEEIDRKDFESSVEQAIDLMIPFDAKLAVQAAKAGKPLVEAAKGSKLGTALAGLAPLIVDEVIAASGPKSLLDHLADLRGLLAKPAPKA